MKTKTQLKVWGLVISSSLLLYGCQTFKKPQPKPSASYNINRPPVEAPQTAKITDFRLNPPQVLDMTVKRLNEREDLITVQFAADKRLGRTVTINPDAAPTILHDDGTGGDEKAGDHVFSAIIPSDFDSLAAEQDRLLTELVRSKAPLTVPIFRGRDVIGEEKIDLAELRRLRNVGIIKFPPFGAGAFQVVSDKSLFITDTNVVGDPGRTFNPCTGVGTPMGKWTFGYLMTAMANQPATGVDPSDFVLNWLQTWLTDQTVNGFDVPQRTAMQQMIAAWPKLQNGKLDLARAPMKLSAIVNRIDLAANSAYGPSGGAEGRFVFTVLGGNGTNSPGTNGCFAESFTVILEYGVPIHTCTGLKSWAQQWLNLQNFALGSPPYNAALEAITEQFAAANADPSKPNGSALDQLRTDEIALSSPWELREFQVGTNNQLNEVTVKQTPEKQLPSGSLVYFQGGSQNGDLVKWLNQNAAAVAANTYTVPDNLPFAPNAPFLGGASPNNIDFWNATPNTPPISSEAVRHQFSLNTCNGCHGGEAGATFTRTTAFRHIVDNGNGTVPLLSDFLTGKNMPVTVPVSSGTQTIPANSPNPTYTYGDLARRAQILSDDASSSCLRVIRRRVLLAPH